MDFGRSDEERALAETLAQNLERVCSTARVRAWETDRVSFDDAFLQAMVDGGFLEAGLPFGDAPQFAFLAQLEEVAGRFLAPQVLSWLSGYAASLLGDHTLARRVAAGEVVAPVVPGRANLHLKGGRLSGSADGVLFVDKALKVLAPVEGGLALVATGDAAAERVDTQSLVPQWRLRFDAAPVIEVVPGWGYELALNRLRTCLAAWAVGAASQALDLAAAYARERVQFEHPIGSYQSVQNRLVDAAIQVEQARMLVYRAAAVEDDSDVARLAKYQAGKAFALASRGALMTFGGYGFTVDFDIQLYFRRAKEAQLSFEQRPDWELVPAFRS